MSYKPLNYNLTITPSLIDGLGLMTTESIPKDTNLGLFHYHLSNIEILRTPLAGHCNHSDTPNCYKSEGSFHGSTQRVYLFTLRDIKEGEELTIKYDLYKV